MGNRAIQLLTLVLCVALAGAQACACREPANTATGAASSHACCTSDPAPPSPDGCQDCQDLIALPKAADVTPAATHFTPLGTPVIENHSLAPVITRAGYPLLDVRVPAMLRDLHHLNTQLTE
jgi:hypothetical protein